MSTHVFNGAAVKPDPEALLAAAADGDLDTVRAQLEAGVNIDATTASGGATALMWATQRDADAIVELLLERGANVDIRDLSCGETALMWAAEHGRSHILRLLLEKNPALDAKDNEGMTALMYAAQRGFANMAEQLLEKGASIDATDNTGKTAREYAASANTGGGVAIGIIDKYVILREEQRKAAEEVRVAALKVTSDAVDTCRNGVDDKVAVRRPLQFRTPSGSTSG